MPLLEVDQHLHAFMQRMLGQFERLVPLERITGGLGKVHVGFTDPPEIDRQKVANLGIRRIRLEAGLIDLQASQL